MLFFSFARGETKEEIVLEVVFLKFHIGRVLPLPSERRFVKDNLMRLRHILHTLLELLKREIKGQASGRSSASTMFNEYSFHERYFLSCLLLIKICRFHQFHVCKCIDCNVSNIPAIYPSPKLNLSYQHQSPSTHFSPSSQPQAQLHTPEISATTPLPSDPHSQ